MELWSGDFWIVVIVSVLGFLFVGEIGLFAWKALSEKTRGFANYEKYLEFLASNNIRTNIPRYINEAYSEYLEKRNEFWTTYGQVMIAAFIVIILAILMLTKTITAEAGLPILSAISGFAIAKSVSTSKNSPSNPNDENRG